MENKSSNNTYELKNTTIKVESVYLREKPLIQIIEELIIKKSKS